MLVSSCYEQNIFEKPTQTVKMGMDGDEKLTIHLLGLTSSLLGFNNTASFPDSRLETRHFLNVLHTLAISLIN